MNPRPCACGSSRFHLTYQAWTTGEIVVRPDGSIDVTDVRVDGDEMHGDWLDSVRCAECGLRYDDSGGLVSTDGSLGPFTDNDGNTTEEQPALLAVAQLDIPWPTAPIRWAR